MKAGQKLLLALLGRLAPSLAVGNGLNPEWISRDTQVVRNYRADPLVYYLCHAEAGELHRRWWPAP